MTLAVFGLPGGGEWVVILSVLTLLYVLPGGVALVLALFAFGGSRSDEASEQESAEAAPAESDEAVTDELTEGIEPEEPEADA